MGNLLNPLAGMGGGANGTGFAAPQGSPAVNPTNSTQIQQGYNGTQNSLQQQQALLQALQAQNGLQNQSNTFNQLQGVANGTGPNPAKAALAQATGQNVANQNALMAGQRGANQNVGLIARQAAQQGANTQQQAAGQGATQANTAANQAQQNALLGAQNQYNSNLTSGQNSVNSANAALAGAQMSGQQNMLGSLTGAVGSALPMLGGSGIGALGSGAGGTGGALGAGQGIGAGLTDIGGTGAADEAGFQTFLSGFGDSLGGMASSIGTGIGAEAAGAPAAAEGIGAGVETVAPVAAEGMAGGGKVKQLPEMAAGGNTPSMMTGPQSYFGKMLAGNMPANTAQAPAFAQGGAIPALVSPGEKYLPPKAVEEVKKGKNPMKVGETIPGKAKVKGAKNSYANDTVPKTLEEGGIVLPRSVTQAKHPQWEAHKFVGAILKQQAMGKGKK